MASCHAPIIRRGFLVVQTKTWLKSLTFFVYALTRICHSAYIKKRGICIRNYCGTQPSSDLEHAGLVTTVGRRDRASTSYVAADRVKAPASTERGRFRGINR